MTDMAVNRQLFFYLRSKFSNDLKGFRPASGEIHGSLGCQRISSRHPFLSRLQNQLLELPHVPQRLDLLGRDPVLDVLALQLLGQPVLDEEIALYVKLGVLAMAEYWWFT